MNKTENGKANGDEFPEEIQLDYAKAKPNRFAALDPDVAAVFGNAETVNRVLRALIETMPSTPAEAA